MKSPTPLFMLVAFLAAVPLGCGRNDGPTDASGSGPVAALDLAKVERAFASAKGSIKVEFDKVVAAIKSADYSGALTKLQTLAGNAELSEDQKTALRDLLAQVKSRADDLMTTAGQAADRVKQEAGQLVDQARDAAGKAADRAVEAANKAADSAKDAASKAANNALPK